MGKARRNQVTRAQLTGALVQTKREVQQQNASLELYQERIAELEFAMEDAGWQRMTLAAEQREFSRDALQKLIRFARLSYLKNPLINHACRVQADYVWGQGCTIVGKDEKINEVIQEFLEFPKNRMEFTGHQARTNREIEAQVESNIFLVLFTNQSNGMVTLSSVHFDEVVDVYKNPDDCHEPWYYLRVWEVVTRRSAGQATETKTMRAYYPDYRYKPQTAKPSAIDGVEVRWDSPMMHIKTGGFSDMTFGVPEIYASLDWARAVKEDLEDYVTIRRALSRFVWNLQTKTGGRLAVASTKEKLQTTIGKGSAAETNPPPTVGATFLSTPGQDIAPIKTAGMVPSPDEGKRLWLMVSAGTGIPEPILAGDADVGNFATAKTLDRPTELKMRTRQTMWADIYSDLLNYVVDQAVLKPNGPLNGMGTEVVDPYTGEAEVEMDGETDRTIDIRFPTILERDKLADVQAITLAATLNGQTAAGTMTDRSLSRLLLTTLGEEDIDEVLDELYPDNTPWGKPSEEPEPPAVTPFGPANGAPGQPPSVTKVGNQEPDMTSSDERVVSTREADARTASIPAQQEET